MEHSVALADACSASRGSRFRQPCERLPPTSRRAHPGVHHDRRCTERDSMGDADQTRLRFARPIALRGLRDGIADGGARPASTLRGRLLRGRRAGRTDPPRSARSPSRAHVSNCRCAMRRPMSCRRRDRCSFVPARRWRSSKTSGTRSPHRAFVTFSFPTSTAGHATSSPSNKPATGWRGVAHPHGVGVLADALAPLGRSRTTLEDLLAAIPGVRREDLRGDTHAGCSKRRSCWHCVVTWSIRDTNRCRRSRSRAGSRARRAVGATHRRRACAAF